MAKLEYVNSYWISLHLRIISHVYSVDKILLLKDFSIEHYLECK